MAREKSKDDDRTRIIKELHELAEQVLELKNTHRQKHPIVIEFAGSPKAGKTSCINSLALFLKRNGFRVEIIHERAGVCPVNNKQSPMFNLWTSCMSVAGMLGVLEREFVNCDVLILDRGIFDALCWFEWLDKNGMIDCAEKNVMQSFLLMDSLVKRIDIVFAFSVDPTISIKREYATLLTNKLGSIMNEHVLCQYLSSIETVVRDRKEYFHDIIRIDTSEKNQDEVGKEVTDRTLDALRGLLVEKIGFFESSQITSWINNKGIFPYVEFEGILGCLQFKLRDEVEISDSYIQPIPIAVITNHERNKVLVIKKNSKSAASGSPEKDKILLYVGGHTRNEDITENIRNDFISICKYTLRREINEEIGISLAINGMPDIIYTPISEKSKRHMAICFLLEIDIETTKLRLDPQELVTTKGTSKSGKFIDINTLAASNEEFESWSTQILNKYFNVDKSISQISIFDLD